MFGWERVLIPHHRPRQKLAFLRKKKSWRRKTFLRCMEKHESSSFSSFSFRYNLLKIPINSFNIHSLNSQAKKQIETACSQKKKKKILIKYCIYMYSITKERQNFFLSKKTKLNYCKLTLINQPPQKKTTTKLYWIFIFLFFLPTKNIHENFSPAFYALKQSFSSRIFVKKNEWNNKLK